MIGGVCHFDRVFCFLLGMVGSARLSSSLCSSSSSISSLIESSILVLVSWFQETIARVVSYFSTLITSLLLSSSFFLLGDILLNWEVSLEERWWCPCLLFLVSLGFGGITLFDTALLCWFLFQ